VDFGILLFFVIVALIVRGLVRSINTVNSSSKSAARRRQLQQIAERMRATARPNRPGFPQPPGATYRQEVGGPGYQSPPTARPGSTAPFQRPPTARPGSTAPFQPPPTARPGSTAPFQPPPGIQQPPTASIAPPTPAFTAQWPSGAPMDPRPPSRAFDPVVVEVAADPAPESAYPTDEPTGGDVAPDTTTPTRRRYELPSSIDTTLSTSLTSSLFGGQGSVAGGPQTIALPPDLRLQVLDLVGQGYEVAAVRLVCDEMGVGILDAHTTVRSLAGLPTMM
jgi:hypothetical protein